MAATIPESERLLPSPEQLELADYKIGSYLSDLNDFLEGLERETQSTLTADEYSRLKAAGALGELGSHFEERDLLALLRFTAEAVEDAEIIRADAMKLQGLVLGELRERDRPRGAAWDAYRGRIRAWHRTAARGG